MTNSFSSSGLPNNWTPVATKDKSKPVCAIVWGIWTCQLNKSRWTEWTSSAQHANSSSPKRILSGTQQLALRIHTRLGRAATTHCLSGSTKITRPRVQLASTMFAWCVDSNQPTEDNCSLTSQSILLRCKGVSTSMSFSLTALSPNSMTLSWDAWRYPLLSSRSTGWDNTTVATKIAATSKLDAFTALMNSNQTITVTVCFKALFFRPISKSFQKCSFRDPLLFNYANG